MAAGEQLKSLGKQLNMPVVLPARKARASPSSAPHSLKEAQRQGATVVIVDTAGRSTIDGELMHEVTRCATALKPERDRSSCSTR